MDKKISVIGIIIDAGKFVLANWGDCLSRALPILFLISAVSYLQHSLGGIFHYTAKFVEPFLYAMFAVSWHRYSVLASEKIRSGLPYKFGIREIKFGALSVFSTLGFVLLLQSLASILPPVLAVVSFLFLLIPVLLTLVFIYPAIALDQPVRIGFFLSKGVRQLTSFIIAFIVICLAIFSFVQVAVLILPTLTTIISANALKLLSFIVIQLVLTPIFLALMASSASFLYRDVIGLKDLNEETSEISPPDFKQDQ